MRINYSSNSEQTYWRKAPAIKRLVFKVIPDEATRLAALQRGEIDIAYSIRGELADELTRTPGLTLKPAVGSAPFWLYFPEQWDPKSPWHDQRVRQAASLAIDRKTINEALTLGYSHLTGSIFPENFDFYWQPPAAGVRSGARQASCWPRPASPGLRCRRLLLRHLLRQYRRGRAEQPAGSRHPGEAAPARTRRLLHGLLGEEAEEHRAGRLRRLRQLRDARRGLRGRKAAPMPMAAIPISTRCSPSRRCRWTAPSASAILQRLQQLVHEKAIYAPIWQLGLHLGRRTSGSGNRASG